MNVNGYKLKEAIKMAQLELDTVRTQFDETLYAFEDEDKQSPKEVMDRIAFLEAKVTLLQTAQSEYNLQVLFEYEGREICLEQAIKLVGGRGRVSKMWRNAAKGQVRDKWDHTRVSTRKTDEEVAKPTLSRSEALRYAQEAERAAASLRSLIAQGNAKEIDVGWFTADLFEVE